jgi:hypothetical protein
LAELLNELVERYTWLVPFGSDGLLQVKGIFQVFEELGDDLIGQLIYELFGASLRALMIQLYQLGPGRASSRPLTDQTRLWS